MKIILLIIFLLSSVAMAQKNTKDPHPETLRVMSYNCWYTFTAVNKYIKDRKLPNGPQWVDSQTPDVVGLQELVNIRPEKLTDLGKQWGHSHTSLLKTKKFSVGITSRWPIETIEKSSLLGGRLSHGYLHAKTNGVHYFVVHLSPARWDTRMKEAKMLMSKITPLLKAKEKVIVLGDFNSESPEDKKWLEASKNASLLEKRRKSDASNGRIQNLKDGQYYYGIMEAFFKGGLIDTAKGHLPETFEARLSSPTGVWDKEGGYKTVKMGRRIDFILSCPDLYKKVTSCKIITKGDVNLISDHYPVITDFSQK